MLRNTRSFWITAGLFTAVLAILLLHALHYMPFLSDDALISLRYSDRLLHGHGLTWTEGRPVEGYSNLLWVLLAAGIGAFGADLIDAVRVLGVMGMSAVLVSVVVHYARAEPSRQTLFSMAIGLLFYSLASPVAVWAIGGMEQPLIAALLGLALPLSFVVMESEQPRSRTVLLLSLLLGLLCITRPDSPVFVVAVVLSIPLGRRMMGHPWSWRAVLLPTLLPLAFCSGQMALRLLYYGELVPNTALVKISPSLYHFVGGLRYVMRGFHALLPFSVIAIVLFVVLLASRRSRPRGFVLLLTMILWLGYVVFIGGDIFPAHRHFIPVIVIITFVLVDATRVVEAYLMQRSGLARSLFSAGLLALFIPHLYLQLTDPRSMAAIKERWEWNGQVMGLLLKDAFTAEQPLIAVTAAGCLPYWSELPALDMLGLNDYYIPRHPPRPVGGGIIGHELGDCRYVLSREPDLIIFHTGKPKFFSEACHELLEDPEFRARYTPVNFRGLRPHEHVGMLWVRAYSGKIGIRCSEDEIRIPGFLLNSNPATVAYLDREGKLVVPVSAGQHAGAALVPGDIGDWALDVEAVHPEAICGRVESSEDTLKVILTTAGVETIEVRAVVLRKSSSGVPQSE